MKICKTYDFLTHGDDKGWLVSHDKHSILPFEIRRVYYIFGTQSGVIRGNHAHKKLHQIAICLSGSCRMVLDNGFERDDLVLDSPKIGLDLPPMMWHEMHDFSEDCVLLVLASDHYDEEDYIRDYEKFKK